VTGAAPTRRRRPAPWRDVRVLSALSQIVAVVLVLGAVWFLVTTLLDTMAARGLDLDLSILSRTAGFEIGEHLIAYAPTDSYGHAMLVGLLNTILVSVLGIVFATIVGLGVGLARLSRNFLLSRLAAGYVELFRNTPVLVQLFILYFAVFLQLPRVRDSIALGDVLYLNQRGLYLPAAQPLAPFTAWMLVTGIGVLGALAAWALAARRAADGRPTRRLGLLGLLLLVVPSVVAWLVLGDPVRLQVPIAGRFNIEGGTAIRAEFMALLVGLVLYTAAFIAEIVRGGIQAVPRGQVEAARSVGLSEGLVTRLVVLPQAMRIIVPPLTSQYLNLAKNSSLAIVIGYADLFNVSTTAANQTGQPVTILLLVMGAYLALSLATSLFMNVYNRHVQLRER
jgi:general L-amino acid transport system permease protein